MIAEEYSESAPSDVKNSEKDELRDDLAVPLCDTAVVTPDYPSDDTIDITVDTTDITIDKIDMLSEEGVDGRIQKVREFREQSEELSREVVTMPDERPLSPNRQVSYLAILCRFFSCVTPLSAKI